MVVAPVDISTVLKMGANNVGSSFSIATSSELSMSDGSLQTPPPTILPRRKYSTFSRHVQPIPLTAAVSRPSPCLSEASLPTPITIARSILSSGSAWREPLPSNLAGADMSAPPHTSNPIFAQPHGQISASGGNQISGSSRERGRDQERNDDNDLFADPSAFQMLVLSSQTQDADNQPLQALTDLSTVGPIFRVPPLPGRNLSRNILVVGDSDSDSDGFIQSSQSQHILPHHISPRRKCAGQLLDSVRSSLVDESTLEEVVPSSQSQTELELNMFMRISDYLPHYTSGVRAGCVHARVVCPLLMRLIRVRQSESSSHRNDLPSAGWSPAAILHDELSHVPNQDMILSNEDTTDDFVLAPVDSLGSATEDESEDEFSIRRTHGTASTRILSVRTLDAVTLSDEVLEETAEYINSLPHTVQDFEVMFGESSGSLPGDFPMSLR